MIYYDTHSHPYLAEEMSQEEILETFFTCGGKYLNSIACDIKSSQTCINLAKKYTGIFASIGIHPTHVLDSSDSLEQTIEQLEKLYYANCEHIVAIGEIGLDYHWLESLSTQYTLTQEEIVKVQKGYFRAQIQLAKKLNLPIIIHNRNSAKDVFEILVEQDCKNFVFHCYSENLEYAQKLLELSPECKLGFGGVVTFKSALTVQETAQNIPLKNILIETDSPYLTPTPLRGKQENEPILVKHVLSKIIDLRSEPSEEITKQIFKNSINFFGLEK